MALQGGPSDPNAEELLTATLHWLPDGAACIVLAGELDIASRPKLRARLEEALAEGRADVVVDVAHLAFCDASGLDTLIDAYVRLAGPGRRLVLDGVSARLARTVELAGAGWLLAARR